MTRSHAANGELALLLEVSSTPKPGNVDRHREYPDLRFEHFVTGAVGARPGLELAADPDAPLGRAFERAVAGMSEQTGGNTQFGAVLMVTPLVRAATVADGRLTPETVRSVVDETTVADAVDFYRAFEHVAVAVDDPPADLTDLDVRRGADAAGALRERDCTWLDVMRLSADVDGLAEEWVEGFPRTFDAAERILEGDGPVTDRAASVYLEELADRVDTFVVTQHDRETATEVRERAKAALDGEEDVEALAAESVDREINPGTTADLIAGALFVALEWGLEV